MKWPALLRAWWRGKRVAAPQHWPTDRTPGTPRFAPQQVERLPDDAELEERIEVLDWRVREFARDQALDRERYRRERRP